jgi:hypothetical protein
MPTRLTTLLLFAALLIAPPAPLTAAEPPAAPPTGLELQVRLLEIDLGIVLKQYEKIQTLLHDAELQAVLAEDQEASLPEAERDTVRAKREAISRHDKLRSYHEKLRMNANRIAEELRALQKTKAGKE